MHRRRTIAIAAGAAIIALYSAVLYGIPLSIIPGLRIPVEGTPADHGIPTYERVEIPGPAGSRLVAWWMPAPETARVVVVVHGGGSNRNDPYIDTLGIADRLIALGYSTLAFDMRGHGDSDDYPPEPVRIGPSNAPDVSAAIDWLTTRVTDPRVGVLGASMGGATVIHAAALDPRIRGVIAVDPVLDAASALENFVWAGAGAPRWFVRQIAISARLFHRSRIQIDGYDTIATAAGIDEGRLLVIQDVGDPITTVTFARKVRERNPHVQYWETPVPPADGPLLMEDGRWGTHTKAFRLFPEAFMTRVADFFEARLTDGGDAPNEQHALGGSDTMSETEQAATAFVNELFHPETLEDTHE